MRTIKTHRTLEELLEESKKSKDDVITEFVDYTLYPAILRQLNHRMYYLVKNQTFPDAITLFKEALHQANEWYKRSTYFEDGYKIKFEEPDNHGRVNMNIRFTLSNFTRIYNLASMVDSILIINATNGNFYI